MRNTLLLLYLIIASTAFSQNDTPKNGALYAEYKKLGEAETKVIFGGRLGEYKYYDMDAVIAAALDRVKKEFN